MLKRIIKSYLWRVFAMSVCAVVFLTGCGEDDYVLIGSETSDSGFVEEGNLMQVEQAEENAAEQGQETTVDMNSTEASVIVHVCGAVNVPGVYVLTGEARVQDALTAAGGFTEDADRDYVNLAAVPTDGEKIYFPTMEEVNENRIPYVNAFVLDKAADGATSSDTGLVNINTADKKALCSLPGIGETKAGDIIAYREKNGSFTKCKDIMKVPGIKQNLYEKIADYISVD